MSRLQPPAGLPAVSLWQPWASLTMLEVDGAMVKRFETRGFKPPSTIVGKRVLIHAAKKPFGVNSGQAEVVRSCSAEVRAALRELSGGDPECSHGWPLGAIVGSAIIGPGLPVEGVAPDDPLPSDESMECGQAVYVHRDSELLIVVDRFSTQPAETNIDDQLAFGDWSPGRWAWPLIDPRPLAVPVPCRGSQGVFYVDESVIGVPA